MNIKMEEVLPKIKFSFISQGVVNGIGVYSFLPLIQAIWKRKRVNSKVWKTAIAVGGFIGGYRLVKQLFKVYKIKISEKYQDFISGAAGCGIALIIDDSFIGSLFVIWLCLKAIKNFLPKSDIGPTAIMSMSASVICPAAFLYKDELQKYYQKFMDSMGYNLNRITLLYQNSPIMKKSMHGWNRLVLCDELHHHLKVHPYTSCAKSILSNILPYIFLKSLKIYVPLYVGLQIFKFKFPNRYILENIIRSTIFLTGYTITQYFGIMWFTSTCQPTMSRLEHASFAWLSGLWTFVERKERRPELATYCAAQALNSLYILGKKKQLYTHTPKYISYLLLIISIGTLTCNIDQQPQILQKLIC